MFGDLTGFKVELDGVVNLDFGVGVSDGSTIVRNYVGDLVGSSFLGFNSQEFVLSNGYCESYLGLLGLDGEENESSCNISQHSVMLSGLFEGYNI